MLRPISQLNAKPITTAAIPTHRMLPRVCDSDAVNAAEAATSLAREVDMIWSATGIMPMMSRSMRAVIGPTVSTPAIHAAKESA